MSGVANYPHASIEELRKQYVGRLLEEVDGGPIAVVDRAITRRNCELMLEACEALGVPFRAHVKTHKVLFLYLVFPLMDLKRTLMFVCYRSS